MIWVMFVNLVSRGNRFINSTPIKAYLTVADFYFKTTAIFQVLVDPSFHGKGDKFVTTYYEKNFMSRHIPDLKLMCYAIGKVIASNILANIFFIGLFNLLKPGHFNHMQALRSIRQAVV